MTPEEEQKLIVKYAFFLERYSYQEIFRFLDDLKKQPEKLNFFFDKLYNFEIFGIISNHKIKLARLLAEASGVKALEDDRSRIVFLLAKFHNSNLKAVNQAFATEFGPHFQIIPSYRINGLERTWKELAVRAKEIRNGYRNFDFLNVRSVVREIFSFYKIFEVKDKNALGQLTKRAEDLILMIGDDDVHSPNSPGMDGVKRQLADLYKLSNRLPIDIEKLNEETDFDNINHFLFMVKNACDLRLFLIKNKYPLDDYQKAEEILLSNYGTIFSDSYMGDELKRLHVKLVPLENYVRS